MAVLNEWAGCVQRGGVSAGTTSSPTLLPSQSLQPAFKQGTGKRMGVCPASGQVTQMFAFRSTESHQPGREVGAGGSQRPLYQNTPWPWAHGLPLRQGQRAGCLPSVSSSVPCEFHKDRPQTVPVGLLWGTSALSFKIVWELQI